MFTLPGELPLSPGRLWRALARNLDPNKQCDPCGCGCIEDLIKLGWQSSPDPSGLKTHGTGLCPTREVSTPGGWTEKQHPHTGEQLSTEPQMYSSHGGSSLRDSVQHQFTPCWEPFTFWEGQCITLNRHTEPQICSQAHALVVPVNAYCHRVGQRASRIIWWHRPPAGNNSTKHKKTKQIGEKVGLASERKF